MRSARRDSSESAVKAMMQAGLPPLEPPAHVRLRKGDRPFWDAILKARARDEWPDYDLAVAAQLARCQADIETESKALDAESSMVVNDAGKVVINPRCLLMQQLAQRELSMMRALRLAGRDAGLTSEKDSAKRRLLRQAENARAELHDEAADLLQ
jgi:hypothetical protein